MHRHDGLWKNLLQSYFTDFLGLVVPDIAAELEPEPPRFIEKESFTEPPFGQQALLDVLAEMKAREGPDPVVLVHVEVERRFGRAMDQRMWHYYCHLCLKYQLAIVPIVLFLRGGPAGIKRRKVERRIAGRLVHRFVYWSVGLSASKACHWLEHPPLGVALAACARGDRLPRDEHKLLCMEAILSSGARGAQQQLLLTAVETYLKLNQEQEMKYAERMARSARKAEVQKLELTWAGKLHQKGLQEGVEIGRRDGRQEGRQAGIATSRKMLTKILNRQFGALPDALIEGIERLDDLDRIDEISDRVFEASDLSEIERLLGN